MSYDRDNSDYEDRVRSDAWAALPLTPVGKQPLHPVAVVSKTPETCPHCGDLASKLTDAEELLREIREDRVNAVDEIDKFLRSNQLSRLSAVEADAVAMREALQRLTDQLSVVHQNAAYQHVWLTAQIRNGPYRGPKYEREYELAKTALASKP